MDCDLRPWLERQPCLKLSFLTCISDHHDKCVELSIRTATDEAKIRDGIVGLDISEGTQALTVSLADENRRPCFNMDRLSIASAQVHDQYAGGDIGRNNGSLMLFRLDLYLIGRQGS